MRAVVIILAGWATVALWLEVERASATLWLPDTPPSLWRFDSPPVQALGSALQAVDQAVPRGSVVVIEANELAPSELFFLMMWCSYYLPRHDVVRPHVGTEGPRYVWSYPEGSLRLARASVRDLATDDGGVVGSPR